MGSKQAHRGDCGDQGDKCNLPAGLRESEKEQVGSAREMGGGIWGASKIHGRDSGEGNHSSPGSLEGLRGKQVLQESWWGLERFGRFRGG